MESFVLGSSFAASLVFMCSSLSSCDCKEVEGYCTNRRSDVLDCETLNGFRLIAQVYTNYYQLDELADCSKPPCSVEVDGCGGLVGAFQVSWASEASSPSL